MNEVNKTPRKKQYILAFVGNLLIALIVLLPTVIANGGFLTMSEDFNAQTIPFYYMIHNSVRSGEVFWNWSIDIGSDFWTSMGGLPVGGVFSPFMWLIPLVPESFLPNMTWIILALKYATAGLTSFMFIRRYTQSTCSAFSGSVLYAFSGTFAINLIFNIMDGAVFFPLLLWAVDELILDKKRGRFIVAVFLNVCAAFALFVSSFIALIIYFCLRHWSWDRKLFQKIGLCMLEGILGVGLACFTFFPQALVLLGDKRTSLRMTGDNGLTYSTKEILMLIRGILFPAEAMSNGSWIAENDWWSNSAYLPMVSVFFVGLFIQKDSRHWASRLLILCLIIACVPLLNNIFMLETVGAYRRWFYFPVLIMAMVTARCFENSTEYKANGMFFALMAVITLFLLYVLVLPWDNTGEALSYLDYSRFSTSISYTILGAIICVSIWRFAHSQNIDLYMLTGIIVFAILSNQAILKSYQLPSAHSADEGNSVEEINNELFNTGETVNAVLDSNEMLPYRITYWNAYWNHGMMNHWPARLSFISIVDHGINELYDAVDSPRGTAITPYGPAGMDQLLSTKYILLDRENSSYRLLNAMDTGNRQLYLYEDVNALPIGFTYDIYMTKSEFNALDSNMKALAMLKALVINDEDVPLVSQTLSHYDPAVDGDIKAEDILQYQLQRGNERSQNFSKSIFTFSSFIPSAKDKYAFFSVPCNKYWTATVNGEPVNILNINGLMAVPVQAGDNDIRFVYRPWPTFIGFGLSLAAFLGCIVYFFQRRKKTLCV